MSAVHRLAVLCPDVFATGVYLRWAGMNYKAVVRHGGRDGKEVGDEPGMTKYGGADGRGVEGLRQRKGLPGQVSI